MMTAPSNPPTRARSRGRRVPRRRLRRPTLSGLLLTLGVLASLSILLLRAPRPLSAGPLATVSGINYFHNTNLSGATGSLSLSTSFSATGAERYSSDPALSNLTAGGALDLPGPLIMNHGRISHVGLDKQIAANANEDEYHAGMAVGLAGFLRDQYKMALRPDPLTSALIDVTYNHVEGRLLAAAAIDVCNESFGFGQDVMFGMTGLASLVAGIGPGLIKGGAGLAKGLSAPRGVRVAPGITAFPSGVPIPSTYQRPVGGLGGSGLGSAMVPRLPGTPGQLALGPSGVNPPMPPVPNVPQPVASPRPMTEDEFLAKMKDLQQQQTDALDAGDMVLSRQLQKEIIKLAESDARKGAPFNPRWQARVAEYPHFSWDGIPAPSQNDPQLSRAWQDGLPYPGNP